MPKGMYKHFTRDLIYVVGPSIVYVPLTREKFTVIEVEDAVRVAKRNWHFDGGARSNTYKQGSKIQTPLKMSRFLMRVKDSKVLIDHKNGNALDNRRHGNLRKANRRQNMLNSKVRSTSKTGVRGVYKRGSGKYGVSIGCVGAKKWLGTFDTLEEAATVYRQEAKKIHGEFYYEK